MWLFVIDANYKLEFSRVDISIGWGLVQYNYTMMVCVIMCKFDPSVECTLNVLAKQPAL